MPFTFLCVKWLNVTKYIENNETFQNSNISTFTTLQRTAIYAYLKNLCNLSDL